MSKLWIVHRQARRRDALARLSGLAADELVVDGPESDAFGRATPPAAIVIGLEADFEQELEFLHRHRAALEGARRLLLVAPGDADEARRLTGAGPDEIREALPDARALRDLVLSAVAHRAAEPLAERLDRERVAARFASWFGDVEIPGLFRALDPALASLPLLVRGVPGSGRGLVARYVELYRVHGASGPTLRLDARELTDADDLAARLARRAAGDPPGHAPARCIWIDEVDTLAPGVQHALAEWIRLGASPIAAVGQPLRWIATAGPDDLRDRLEPALASALAPLVLEIPELADARDELARFAERVAADWSTRVGSVPRRLEPDASDALEPHAWTGDRARVEAVLRRAFAATARDPLRAEDIDAALAAAETPLAPSATPETEAPAFEPDTERERGDFPPAEFATAPVIPPATPTEDLEQAFLEGLPEVVAEPEATAPPSELETLAVDPERDASSELSDASFELAATEATDDADGPSWRRLARSLSHEIRNPLVSIRTFAELLPEHFADESFRERFTELVGRDVAHIDEVVGRLADAAAHEKPEASPVDVSALLERLLDERRGAIGARRLLVLRELERDAPTAWADPHGLEVALAGLLDRALAALPERGDLFVATRRIDRGPDGAPRLRILLRHHNPELGGGGVRPDAGLADAGGLADVSAAANVLEYVLAETLVEAHGGQLTIDSTDAQETLILVDLRTPA